jgi:predicted AlkP superfamily phosphohydrolase/phosphomutase
MSTVVIGLDGATHAVLDPLMDVGVMPFLRSFCSEGVRGHLLSTTNPLTPPAWTTLATGCHPGRHGIFDFVRPEPAAYGIYVKLNDARDVRCPTLWDQVSAAGLRVGALNYPLTSPAPQVRGYVVPGFVSARHLRRAVHPPGLYEELAELPEFHPHHLAWDFDTEQKAVQPLDAGEHEGWIRHHIERERQWFTVLEHLMQAQPCDLTAVVFDGVDKLQHLAWPLIDLDSFPEPATAEQERLRALCLDYFRRLDGYLERIVDRAGPDATTLIVSDHGFGPSYDVFHLNVWLRDAGYLRWTDDGSTVEGADAMFATRHRTQLFDWAHTTAYALTPSSNGIYLTASPGTAAYDRLRDEVIEGLAGVEVVEAVMTREEAYPGDQGRLAPDLTLRLRDQGFVSVVNADAPLRRRPEPRGMHRSEGVVFAAGPGIPAGRTIAACSIADIFPLVLHSLGLEIPAGLDGRLPAQIRSDAPLIGPAASAADRAEGGNGDAELTPDEEEAVFAQLRLLGYME